MKTTRLLLSAALALTFTACDKKPDPTLKATPPEAAPKVRDAEPKAPPAAAKASAEAPKTGVDPQKVEAPVKEKPAAPPTEAKKPAASAKNEVEQGLQSTVDHGRAVTKSENSKTRTKAQKAEDEMLEMQKQK